ncbi:hypothetical protein [Endozoicomonas sp.]|uniref:hypothetical protein n=1 Tax=Endozoicomonas sp. TaxID=1892382 RepID=UPI0028863D39|nr:hypothetical protein [Endozoicomonas sp.]
MSKKTIAVLVAMLLAIGVAGWFFYATFYAGNDRPVALPVTDIVPVEDVTSDASVKEVTEYPEVGFDEPSDETRIILVEPENGELTDLLSEKVIRNDKIVDKSPTEQ